MGKIREKGRKKEKKRGRISSLKVKNKISIEAIVIVEKRSSNRQESSFSHIDTVSIGFREKMSDIQIT